MTTEEKARAYDEAIERARNLHKDAIDMEESLLAKQCEIIFPELKSKDEKIKEALMEFFELQEDNTTYSLIPKKDILTWLEKQGQTFTKKDVDDAYLKGVCDAKQELEKQGEPYNECNQNIEKQDESVQKVESHIISTQEYICINDCWDPAVRNGGKQVLFKGTKYMGTDIIRIISKWGFDFLNEEIYFKLYFKPIETSAKFKVGDWIVFNGLTLYIKGVVKGYYRTISKGGITNSYSWDIDDVARLWTIRDARSGDILQADKCTLIFDSLTKDIDNKTAVSSWYFCDSKKFYGMGTSKPDLWDSINIVPTTKEQRDLLFSKMREAGYEWDAEKKELKKIEQNPAWSEEDDYNVQCAIAKATYDIQKGNVGRNNELINWLKSLKDRMKGKEE